MWKTADGSTGRLLQLCAGYFLAYVITGLSVKYFTGSPNLHLPGMSQVEYLVYSTIGGSLVCLCWVLLRRWYAWAEAPRGALGYIIPSGICTAIVVPTTTMMYLLPISVMVAQVIMRAGVIVIGRIVDGIQIRQGILRKRVYPEENVGVLLAVVAAATQLLTLDAKRDFDFVHSPNAWAILSSYLVAYAIRIYIMNYYKNTRPPGAPQNNEWFFAIEQIAASIAMFLAGVMLYQSPDLASHLFPGGNAFAYRKAFVEPLPIWPWAVVAGSAFGIAAFFSVFLFMFKGRTATFANLVNRLTSLVAGTTATLLFALAYGGRPPKREDWLSLGLVFLAMIVLASAEKRRVRELASVAPAPRARVSR